MTFDVLPGSLDREGRRRGARLEDPDARPMSVATSRRSRPTRSPTRPSTRRPWRTRSPPTSRSSWCSRRPSSAPAPSAARRSTSSSRSRRPTRRSRSSTSSRTSPRRRRAVSSSPSSTRSGDLQATDVTNAWGLTSEPWIFAVDATGVVRGSYELIATPAETRPGDRGHHDRRLGRVLEPDRLRRVAVGRYQTRTGDAVSWCSDEVARRELGAVLEVRQAERQELAVGRAEREAADVGRARPNRRRRRHRRPRPCPPAGRRRWLARRS